MNLQNFFDEEPVDPIRGYNERDVEWFEENILPDFESQIRRSDDLLDVGCGYGYFTVRYAKRVASVVGVDLSPVRIKKAKEVNSAPNVKYRQVDITSDAIPFGPYDVAVSSAVFQHIHPDLRAVAFTRAYEALKPGATLVLYDEDFSVRPEKWHRSGWYEPLSLNWLHEELAPLFEVWRTDEPIAKGNHGEEIFRFELTKKRG